VAHDEAGGLVVAAVAAQPGHAQKLRGAVLAVDGGAEGAVGRRGCLALEVEQLQDAVGRRGDELEARPVVDAAVVVSKDGAQLRVGESLWRTTRERGRERASDA